MYLFLRKILFFFDPESVHYFTMKTLSSILRVSFIRSIFKRKFLIENQNLVTNAFGIEFKNPVGVAAGFDKNAKYINELSYCGFGFIEIGTLTPKGQEGNPKKRLFRLKRDEAIINRMGFNNDGVVVAIDHLKKARKNGVIVGGNIGKNKITPNEQATEDYLICFEKLFDFVDYFVVNVSSPNTPNLRALQEREPLEKLLSTLVIENNKKENPKPILLKIAPDLSNDQLDDIIDIVRNTKIHGLIATNTTISRSNLSTSNEKVNDIGAGGLSGKPLMSRSTEVIKYIHQKSNASIPIIGVGGIHSAEDAIEKMKAGAVLIQLYTGFIYEGPSLIRKINEKIIKYRGGTNG
ncbi:MAG: quinone-dependent dihydroorotate dehydrogenase [Crocinitomicaceae bacterium]|nr:quinone-dependent dihydroorotate dehydrogenase [Crocinitomicaceae bacterium]